jgi:DNA-binding transcriptional ArsR family regulator
MYNQMVIHSCDLDSVFAALADPVRRTIVEQLTRSERTAGEIARSFSISQPAVSKHLKVLERSGLLERTIRGREHHLRLAPGALTSATTWIDEQRRFWSASFDRLDGVLAESSGKDPAP